MKKYSKKNIINTIKSLDCNSNLEVQYFMNMPYRDRQRYITRCVNSLDKNQTPLTPSQYLQSKNTMTFKQIANKLKLSEEQVKTIYDSAMNKIHYFLSKQL